MMGAWRLVFKIDEIPVSRSRVVAAPQGNIAVFRGADGRVFAVEDRDDDSDGRLSNCVLNGTELSDPRRDWMVDLAGGAAALAQKGLGRLFDVHVSDGRILLNMSGMGL